MPIFSGYGAEAVATRLHDCEAKLLITADGFYRRGKPVADEGDRRRGASPRRPSVEHVPRRATRRARDVPWTEGRDVWWHDAAGRPVGEPFETERDRRRTTRT